MAGVFTKFMFQKNRSPTASQKAFAWETRSSLCIHISGVHTLLLHYSPFPLPIFSLYLSVEMALHIKDTLSALIL